MNTPTNFEMMSNGSEFETAGEEFERSSRRRGGSSRSGVSARRGQPSQRRGGRSGGPSAGGYSRPYGYGGLPYWPVEPPQAPSGAYRRCMEDCLRAPPAFIPPASAAPEPPPPDADAAPPAPEQETSTHRYACQCPKCQAGGSAFEAADFRPRPAVGRNGFGADETESFEGEGEGEFEGEGEGEGEFEGEYEGEAVWSGEGIGPFSEAEEIALAAELLSVSNEAELEQFLGNLWSGIKKVGAVVGQAAKPFAGVLRSVAKTALPFVGGALGSMIPIPGVGTALGTALGSAVGNALEMEFGSLELEDREFEMARRFVRIAGSAAEQLEQAPAGASLQAAVQAAVAAAAQQHLPHFRARAVARRAEIVRTSGHWNRHGNTLVLHVA